MPPDDRGTIRRVVVDPLTDFLHDEAVGGAALLIATIAALVWANLAADSYTDVWTTELDVGRLHLDLQDWVNDALMAIFFFVVGLEIKRELVVGELQDRRAAALPVLAALGGVVLPALVFVAVLAGGEGSRGWAIPTATDIAFAVGALALLRDRVSSGAKLLLLAIAIVDDIVAIVIIAVFYAESLTAVWLLASLGGLGAIALLRAAGVARILVYVPIGMFVWFAVHESGVHATIAGVALGLMTPTGEFRGRPVMETLEHRLHPFSAFVVVPLFALANAGVDLRDGAIGDAAGTNLAWAIVLGLVIGKIAGISAATFAGLRLGWGTLPEGARRSQIWGLAAMGGIGFTVSLFIAELAFETKPELLATAKIGILAGSIASAVIGTFLLARSRV